MTPLDQQRACAHKWQPLPLTCGRYTCPFCAAIGRRDERGGGITRLEPEERPGPALLGCQSRGIPGRSRSSRRVSELPEELDVEAPDPDSWMDP